jgi:hypothetical protein
MRLDSHLDQAFGIHLLRGRILLPAEPESLLFVQTLPRARGLHVHVSSQRKHLL